MAVLVWWTLPVLTTVLAIGWASWVRRTPRHASDQATVEAYARFRAALTRSSTGNTAPPPDV